jgi:flavin reductase (DIM6/NTAB) family NADH-FMN oxidoreductase RutF
VTSLLNAIRHGRPLRHRPIALPMHDQRHVQVVLETGTRAYDVTDELFPCALAPLTLGISGSATALQSGTSGRLRFEDIVSHSPLGSVAVTAGDMLSGTPSVRLLLPHASEIRCEPLLPRMWHDALAWRHTRAAARAAHNLQMTCADLRALNVFYVRPRPVFLVSVRSGPRSNLFPMDLVAAIGAEAFVLALRLTSPSVETMCASREVVVSAAPAAWKETAYHLGAHHKQASIDWDGLPFAMQPSTRLGIPRPVESPLVRELLIDDFSPIGSHMFFRSHGAGAESPGAQPQLAHVSDMYARWRERHGRAFADA